MSHTQKRIGLQPNRNPVLFESLTCTMVYMYNGKPLGQNFLDGA